MANVFFGKVQTNNEYVEFEEWSGITLTPGTSYLMQFQGVACIYVGPTAPQSTPELRAQDGFLLQNNQIFQYTPNATDKLWIKNFGAVAYFNVAT